MSLTLLMTKAKILKLHFEKVEICYKRGGGSLKKLMKTFHTMMHEASLARLIINAYRYLQNIFRDVLKV